MRKTKSRSAQQTVGHPDRSAWPQVSRVLRMRSSRCCSSLRPELYVAVLMMLLSMLAQRVEMKYLGPKLSRLAMDDNTGIVYVGGENRLYQLDEDLRVMFEASTGPKNDSAQCFIPVEPCGYTLTPTNSYNKVLVLDRERQNVIVCGSLFQGRCEARSLLNISKLLPRPMESDLSNVAVVANDETSSSVAFLAPGPPSHGASVLYTAATYSASPGSVLYRKAIPALARRSLHQRNRFFLAENNRGAFSRNQKSALFLNEEIMPTYPIRYITGFSSDGFSYFLTVQGESASQIKHGRLISKIIQVCNEDSLFTSSAEIPLTCTGVGVEVEYNVLQAAMLIRPGKDLERQVFTSGGLPGDVLVGVFTRDNSESSRASAGAAGIPQGGGHAGGSKRRRSGGGGNIDSAVCIFTMEEIRAKLLENIKLCHQGNTSVNGQKYYKGAGSCATQSGFITNNVENEHKFMCNQLESFSNVVGLRPVVKSPAITFYGHKLTALAATVVNTHTVAFLGTDNGRIKKVVLLQREKESFEYHEQIVSPEGEAILPDLHFNEKHRALYALTSTNVTRIYVESCAQMESCNSCLASNDPYCGWCSLENKCGLKNSCPNSKDIDEDRWLQGEPGSCIYIKHIRPSTAPVTKATELTLEISPNHLALPKTSEYTCVFLELGWSSPAARGWAGPACNTSDFRQLGLSLGTDPYRTVTLALNSSETGQLFVKKSFTFYNCSNFHSCTACTDSNFPCDWCVEDNACYDDTNRCKASTIHGKRSLTKGLKGPGRCPQLNTTATKAIFLPAGVERTVVLRGKNIPELRPHLKSYECVLQMKGQRVTAPATRHDDKSLTCDIPPLDYDVNEGSIEADLSVYWGENFWLETTTPLKATVYKCDVLAMSECSLCVNLNYTRPNLNCFWCRGSCLHSSSCDRYSAVTTCPAPRIESVWPLSGPVKGGTNITIEGSNLGAKFEDIDKENSITVANVKCDPFPSLYEPSRRIVCETDWRGQVDSGPIVVKIGRMTSQYKKFFHFKIPRLEDIEPKTGPRSGGTIVTVKGQGMDIGLVRKVYLGDAECTVLSEKTTNTSIQCRTSMVWKTGSKDPIIVYFDGNVFTLTKIFTYKSDPTITAIAPLDSILAGGRILTVKGTGFNSIQQPAMFAFFSKIKSGYHRTNATLCQVMNDRVMKCPTPSLMDAFDNIIRSKRSAYAVAYPDDEPRAPVRPQPIQVVQLGFEMDAVPSVQNLSGVPQLDSQLKYFPNPQVYNFTESGGIKVLKGDALIIEGSKLNIAAEQNEVSVMIGQSPCNVTTFSQSQIVCKLPATQPKVDDSAGANGKTAPWVKVKINSLEFYVGRVEYDVPETYAFPPEAIAGICAGGGILIFIIILILICYRRQRTKAERINNKLQLQLENLESNVRNECKQAFAELQTDMTDLTADLISSGIPFWDFHSYAFKVLFPGMTDHIILHPPIKKNGRFQFSDHGLQTFHQLLGTKLFMMTFIKTLEEQRSFSIRDKANVASLLMIVYLNNMEYATEILKYLLEDLVVKSVEGKHPKLMLRRSESVVEKLLTNWLSICLYKYLRDYAGASLFMLYKAIKLQAEKGPVDFVTGDARYSLSEDTLLREKIEPKMLLLNIESGMGEIFQVRVPDCDTITQTKEKIMDHLYKNIPFSQRPPVKELDLEWRNGPTGPLMLNNVDIASYNKEGWRRLNTLAFYRVPDGAYMMLLHKHSTLKSMNGSLDNSALSIGSVSPILRKEESGFKEWHLVKHDDTLIKDGGVKMISEIFLTRLLSTKGTLQKYVDDFFNNILSASHDLPEVVKYLFDFLDYQADKHGISDQEVVHTWKCNSLPLRFWVNIIKNPDFVFDINKPRIVDSCLSVVAQTFMDSCSTSEHRLGKDSPSNKLLFAKDIVQYRKLVEKFFTDVRKMPQVNEQKMKVFLGDISRQTPKLFYISSALGELYKYVSKYKKELMEALEQDNQAKSLQLASTLGHMVTCIEGPSGEMAFV